MKKIRRLVGFSVFEDPGMRNINLKIYIHIQITQINSSILWGFGFKVQWFKITHYISMFQDPQDMCSVSKSDGFPSLP